MNKKLFRKPSAAMLGGVCAGLGEYFALDPMLIRVFIVLWAVTGGSAFLLYLVLWVVIPLEVDSAPMKLDERIKMVSQEMSVVFQHPNAQLIIFAGIGLIGMGAFFLIQQAGFPWLSWFRWDWIWPVILVLAGLFILFRALTKKK
jgi:phage shock protein C